MAHALNGELLGQLSGLLTNLLSPDNAFRSAAEQQLNEQWVEAQPSVTLMGLAQLLLHNPDKDQRGFCSVLLRRVALKYNAEDNQVWNLVPNDTRQQVRSALLTSLADEADTPVRHKVCDTISEIAKNDEYKDVKWPELLQALLQCSQSQNASHRESAFRIFASVPSLISNQHVDALKHVFTTSFGDPAKEVRVAALKAAVAFLQQADKSSQTAFVDVIPQMLSVLDPLAKEGDEESLVEPLTALIELAEVVPRLYRNVLPSLLHFMISLVRNKEMEEQTRQSALELLLTVAEAAPGMVKKSPDFVAQLVPAMLEMMTEITEDSHWDTTDDLDEDDTDENNVVGEHGVDRLAQAVGGAKFFPVAFEHLPHMLASDAWQSRHAALMAISAMGEGCGKAMEARLADIVPNVVVFFRDPYPRVRYATCNAIGQMCTDFQPGLQKTFHEIILSSLIPVMTDGANPRVQAHSAAALVNFAEASDKATLDPYLDVIFQNLLVLLNTPKTYVQEQAITTIATVADSAEDKFVKYHNAIMPLLFNVLHGATDKKYRLLRGKAMECASLIALAVGKEVFAPNAQDFINILIQTQREATDPDDPQVSYLLASWARMCKVLGTDFLPYLNIVMPPLLQSAQLKPDFAVVDPDEDIESKYSAEDGWEFVGVDGQQIGIKTTVLEEKCTAVEMLICYARELGAGFQPYVEQVMDIVVPLLRFYFHDGVRQAAATVIPLLLADVKKANASPEYQANMWHSVCAKLIDNIANEADPTFLVSLYMAFYESAEQMGPNCLTVGEMESFTNAANAQLKEYYEKLQQRELAKRGPDYDEDDEILAEEEEAEEAVLGELARAVHVLFQLQGTAYLPFFEKMLPIVTTFLADKNSAARQWAVCILDDLVEFCGPVSWNYRDAFLEKWFACVLDEAADVRQAAAYGVGIAAQCGGPDYAEACAAALNNLFQVINHADARSEENIYSTENCISAVSKICKFNIGKFDTNVVLPAWLDALPIVNDEEEAPLTYTYLLDLIDAQNPAILGNENANLPKLLNIFIEAILSGVLSQELSTRMTNTMKAILSSLPESTRQQFWNSLPVEKRQGLQEAGIV